MYVAITSDRGLAGGVHSSICKSIRNDLLEMTPEAVANTKVICVGDKSRAFMARYFLLGRCRTGMSREQSSLYSNLGKGRRGLVVTQIR